MPGRNAAQLVDIHLVETKRIEDSYFQDYARVHERLDRVLEKVARPLTEEVVAAAADGLAAWLAGQAARNVPVERLSQFLRCGLGHICVELVASDGVPLEEVAAKAAAELQRRGWNQAVYDPVAAAVAQERIDAAARAAAAAKPPRPAAARTRKAPSPVKAGGAGNNVGDTKLKLAEAMAKNKVAPAKKEAPVAYEKKSSPATAKPAAKTRKTATVKKAAAVKKPAAKKASVKKAAAPRKTAVRKTAVKKAAVGRPATKKVGAPKKVAAKKAVVKKVAVKKVAEKKSGAPKKAAARKAAPKKAASPKVKTAIEKKPAVRRKPRVVKPKVEKSVSALKPAEEQKPDPTF